MKKTVIVLIVLIMILLAAIYIFIPGRIITREEITIKAPLPAVSRTLMRDSSWHKWWPGNKPFVFHENAYFIGKIILDAIDIRIKSGKDSLPGTMDLVMIKSDSTFVGWKAEFRTSLNPFKRVSRYRQAVSITKDIDSILAAMKTFLEKKENIYGIHVIQTIVQDSVLITTRRSFTHKPGVQEIDNMIQQLKKYIAANNAIEKNYPMLNVVKMSEAEYEAQVAIPVDRKLPETKEFVPKFLLKGGNILEAEITGGLFTVEKAFREFENYRTDHQLSTPAIPFQLLVTDRVKETDTTKWITRLYYPVL